MPRLLDENNPNSAILADHQGTESYVVDLKTLAGYYTGWIYPSHADQATDDNAWDLVTDDSQVAHCMNLLSLWSAGEHFEVISPWQEVSDIVVRALKYCSDFNHARKQLAYDSVLYGLGLQKKVWKKVVWRDSPRS